jgi:hypothetical protein
LLHVSTVGIQRETHIKRQANPHDWLPSLLGDGEKLIEIVYWVDWEAKAEQKKLLYWHDKPNEPSKEGPLLFVLFKSPFTLVSVIRGHHSQVSLVTN